MKIENNKRYIFICI